MSAPFRIPAYCIHKTKGQAYVRLGSQMIYLGLPGSPESKAKYDREVAEWIARGRTPAQPISSAGRSVNEILLAYRRYAATYYINADGTPAQEIERINLAFRPVMRLYGEMATGNFGPKALQVVRQSMIDDQLCRTTINQRIGCIKRAFSWAVSEELVPSSIFHGLASVKGLRRGRTPAKEGTPVKPVPPEYVEAAMKFLPPIVQAMVKLHELTGMRSGELVIMRACDIEIQRPGEPWLYRPSKHKTQNRGHERVVALGPRAQQILKPFLKPDLQGYLFSPAQARAERDAAKRLARKSPVPPSQACRKKRRPKRQPGERYTNASYRRAIAYAVKQAVKAKLIPPGATWHPHQLRHNCATRIRRSVSLDAARAALGHRSLVQTADYAELDRDLAIEVAAKMG